MSRRPHLLLAAAVLLLPGLQGCGLFGGDDDVEPPAELVEFRAEIDVRRRWSTKIGAGAENLRLGLAPVTDALRAYAASRDGRVHALDLSNGNKLWTRELKLTLSAGPGVGDGRVVVAGTDGDVVAMDSASGAELWRRRIAAEVLATPALGGERVVLRTADGRLLALNAATGSEEWVIEEDVPRLSLRGTSAPVIAASYVICGFDNGRLMAVDLLDGTVGWEQTITPPSGRSDLERLVDIDGTVATVGRDLYISGFQGQVGALAVESGQGLWSREMSSYVGPGVDWSNVYVATEDGDVVALSRSTGVEQWRNDVLKRRELTAPTPFGQAVVVGDLEGYLHWIDATSGEFAARVRVDNGRISGRLHAEGDVLLAQTDSGVVAAYEVDDDS